VIGSVPSPRSLASFEGHKGSTLDLAMQVKTLPRLGVLALSLLVVHSAKGLARDASARIQAVEGGEVRLDGGRAAGLSPRMVLDVYSDARVVRLPLSGKDEPLYVHQRVIAQIVVRVVEDKTARAALLGKSQAALSVGLLCLYNPTARAPNQPPSFVSVSPSSTSDGKKTREFAWRDRVVIRCKIENEPEDELYFEWSCYLLENRSPNPEVKSNSGGVLTSNRTRAPLNTWIAPPIPGVYRITVKAIDSAGQSNVENIDYISTGIKKPLGSGLKHIGLAWDPTLLSGLRDIAIDDDGAIIALQGTAGGILGSGSASIRVLATDGTLRESFDLNPELSGATAITLGLTAVYLLDAKNNKVHRFDRADGPIGASLKARFASFADRGTGNGKLTSPIDMVRDSKGRIAVLDGASSAIQVFNPGGVFLFSLGMPGKDAGQIERPVALASGPDGRIYCLDDGRKAILSFWDGAFEREIAVPARGRVTGFAYDPFSGVLGIAELGSERILRIRADTGAPLESSNDADEQPSMIELIKLNESTRVRADGCSGFLVIDREGRSLAHYTAPDSISVGRSGFVGRRGGLSIGESVKVAASPNGQLLALDSRNRIVTRLNRQGWADLRLGGADSRGFSFASPIDIAVNELGSIFVLDAKSSQVISFTAKGYYIGRPLGRPGEGPTELNNCVDLDCSGYRSHLLILQDRKNNNIFQMNPSDGSGQSWPNNPSISDPVAATCDIRGVFWVVDDDVLGSLTPQRPYGNAGAEFDAVSDMSASIDGYFYTVDSGDNHIAYHRPDNGAIIAKISLRPIAKPRDIGIDDHGRIYVFDDSSERVHILTDD
jgi:sugar lactone lactonase YvrE